MYLPLWKGRSECNVEAKGLRMTKAGPAIMRMALYQAGDIGRRWDSQLAAVYYREMVYHGKNHKQAMGAVMSHLGARVLAVLKEDRPYELRDPEGKLISKDEAKKLILSKYHVSEDIRQERRWHKPVKVRRNDQEMTTYRTNEATNAPQPVEVMAISRK